MPHRTRNASETGFSLRHFLASACRWVFPGVNSRILVSATQQLNSRESDVSAVLCTSHFLEAVIKRTSIATVYNCPIDDYVTSGFLMVQLYGSRLVHSHTAQLPKTHYSHYSRYIGLYNYVFRTK